MAETLKPASDPTDGAADDEEVISDAAERLEANRCCLKASSCKIKHQKVIILTIIKCYKKKELFFLPSVEYFLV